MAADTSLDQAIQALRSGDRADARALLHRYTTAEPLEARGWLWLAAASDALADKRGYLQRALALDPSDARVQAALRALDDAPHQPEPAAPPAAPTPQPALAAPARPAPHPLAPPRFVATGVRARRFGPWMLLALVGVIIVLLVPLALLLTS